MRYSRVGHTKTKQADFFEPWMLHTAANPGGVRNATLDEISSYENITYDSIPLHDIVLMLYGTINKTEKAVWFIQLVQCHKRPLEGPHYVRIIGHDCLWVSSLHQWKRKCFGITDKLSFERSVFAIVHSEKKLVRLKNFRLWCTLPKYELQENEMIQICNRKVPERVSEYSITRRTRMQVRNEVTRLVQSYARDLPKTSTRDIMERLMYDIQNIVVNMLGTTSLPSEQDRLSSLLDAVAKEAAEYEIIF